jgi:hypothetical protein
MNQRRAFFKQAGVLAGAFSTQSIFSQWHASEWSDLHRSRQDLTPAELAADEDYWSVIQQAYTVNPAIINLKNGGVSPSPRIVQEAVERYNKLANEGPSYYMWRILDQGQEPLRQKLSEMYPK